MRIFKFRDESKKVIAATLLNYPETDFQWVSQNYPKDVKTALCLAILFFDLIGIESTFLKEMLLKIGVIEELRTSGGDKEVPQTFFHNLLYSQKCSLFHLTT